MEDEEIAELESDELVYLFRDFEDVTQFCKQVNGDYRDGSNMYKLGCILFNFLEPDNLSDHS